VPAKSIKRRTLTKKKAQAAHAKRRLRERYQIGVGHAGLQEMISMIQRGEGVFIEKMSIRVSMWDVRFGGKTVRCLYDKDRKMIITALPQEAA